MSVGPGCREPGRCGSLAHNGCCRGATAASDEPGWCGYDTRHLRSSGDDNGGGGGGSGAGAAAAARERRRRRDNPLDAHGLPSRTRRTSAGHPTTRSPTRQIKLPFCACIHVRQGDTAAGGDARANDGLCRHAAAAKESRSSMHMSRMRRAHGSLKHVLQPPGCVAQSMAHHSNAPKHHA